MRHAVDLLCRAAFYWRSLDDVRDNHMNGNGTGGGVPLSPLTQRCQLLMRFGVEGQNGLIRLCAAAAKNFGRVKVNFLLIHAPDDIPPFELCPI